MGALAWATVVAVVLMAFASFWGLLSLRELLNTGQEIYLSIVCVVSIAIAVWIVRSEVSGAGRRR